MPRRFLSLVVAVVATVALPSGAQRADCKSVTGNLLAKSNCGFDKDVAGWTPIPDTSLAHLPATDGDPTSTAMRVTSGAQGSLSALSACVPVTGAASYRFSARLRTVSGAAFFCALNVWQYSDSEVCGGSGAARQRRPATDAKLGRAARDGGDARQLPVRAHPRRLQRSGRHRDCLG